MRSIHHMNDMFKECFKDLYIITAVMTIFTVFGMLFSAVATLGLLPYACYCVSTSAGMFWIMYIILSWAMTLMFCRVKNSSVGDTR